MICTLTAQKDDKRYVCQYCKVTIDILQSMRTHKIWSSSSSDNLWYLLFSWSADLWYSPGVSLLCNSY